MRHVLAALLLGLLLTCACAHNVTYNAASGVYHEAGCQWAERCTVNCTSIPKTEAERRGALPCRFCGRK